MRSLRKKEKPYGKGEFMKRIIYLLFVFSLLACHNKNEKLTSFLNPMKEVFLDLQDITQFNEVSFLFIIDTSGSMPSINRLLSNNIDVLKSIFEEYPYYTYNLAFTTMSPKTYFQTISPLFFDKESCGLEESLKNSVDTDLGSYFRYSLREGKEIKPEDMVCIISHNIQSIKGHSGTEPFFDSLSYIVNKSDKIFQSRFFGRNNVLIFFWISDAYGEDDKDYNYFLENGSHEEGAEVVSEKTWNMISSLKGESNNVRTYAVVRDNTENEKCSSTEGTGTSPEKYPFHLYRFIDKTGGLRISLCDGSWGTKLQNIYMNLRNIFVSKGFYLEEVPKIDSIEVFFNGKKVPRDRVSGWFFNPEDISIHIGDNFNAFSYPVSEDENIFTIRYQPINIELLRTEEE